MRIRGWKKWLLIGAGALGALVTAGPFVYIHFIQGTPPAPLGLPASATSPSDAPSDTAGTTMASTSVDGTWTITSGSQVGYRVKEILFGQSTEAVGRTSGVVGSFTMEGTTVKAGSFTADMTTVTSDQSRRDKQFQGRIMNTAAYPTGTFTLTKPIELATIPAGGMKGTATATGSLTLHGVTRTVAFGVTGMRSGSTVQVSGQIPITFADYNIDNPSFGPAQTGDTGTLEFLLVFSHS